MSNERSSLKLYREIMFLWLLYFTSFVAVYFLHPSIKYYYFLLLLLLFLRSRKDYWWIAFFIIVFAEIGGLFPMTARVSGATARLPVYSLGFLKLPYYDMVVLSMFFKSLPRQSYRYNFQNKLNIIGLYSIFLYAYSLIIGMTPSNHIATIRAFLSFTMFFSLPRLINDDREKILKFNNLLFSSVFVIISAQTVELLTGFMLGNISGIVYRPTFEYREIRLLYYSPFLMLLCYIFALYFYFSKEQHLWDKKYLMVVAILCTVSIFYTATRGWIIAYSAMWLICYLYYIRKSIRMLLYVIPVILLISAAYNYLPRFQFVHENISTRVQTIEKLIVDGDMTAGGTVGRISVRLPRVITKVKENPITGFGFSQEYYDIADNHVGPVNLLLQAGIIGIGLFIIFFLRYYRSVKKAIYNNSDKSFFVFAIGMIGMLTINATSTQIFGFSGLGAQREAIETLAIFLTCSDKLFTKYNG